ncbi:EamA family transporter [Micromonospora sp. KC606]|uniref:EamA family transporter n=1 Tax=Micromonospora sp. KC606 TaxID=2530379 RepID=UPI001A9F7726|nr:EamA family transporter [Micromonospora sp. KC606]
MNILVTSVTALAPLVWGTTYVVTTELLPPGHPLFAALVRALPAGLIAIALTRTLPRGTWWLRATTLGLLNIGLFLPLLFVSAERLPGGVAATLGAAQPLIVAVLAVAVLRQNPSAWHFAWGIVGVAGVGLVVIGPDAGFDPVGVAAGLAGTSAMALGVILTKRWGRPDGVGPTAYAGWQLTAGGLFLLPVTSIFEGAPPAVDGPAALGYLWLGLPGCLIAYILWFRGITMLPVTSVAVLGLLSPMMAALLGAVLLDQLLSPTQLLGFALALAAIVAAQLTPRSLSQPPTPSEMDQPLTITVVGAAGMAGSRIVAEAGRQGHQVTAVLPGPPVGHPASRGHRRSR